jgi:rhodanese-related sulfurtransferase
MSVATITPGDLAGLQREGRSVDLVDVRTPAEFREIHAEFARSIPLDVLDPRVVMEARNGLAADPLYLICRSGSRSRQAAEKFLAAGYANVLSVEGGTEAWERVGLPVVRGKKTLSLERQVRIAAGTLVFLGAALGSFVHPGFLVLAAFVGAGLVFAGVTDTCGIGMLLARMPWNQIGEVESRRVIEESRS